MPIRWIADHLEAPGKPGAFSHAEGDPPAVELRLWPHRSLSAEGFVTFIAVTCGLISVPLIGLIGTPVLWGLLPFFILTVGGVWIALQRNARDALLLGEELRIWSDRMEILRHNPREPDQHWEANPYWVRLSMKPEGGPVRDYLILSGAGRDVELGAFLSPEERRDLHGALQRIFAQLR
jgi:uncharacterized membrane protein